MKCRTNKRRVLELFHRRFYGPFRWIPAEERLWLDVGPVGREFGSKDFDRLQILDLYSWGKISELEAMRRLGLDQSGLHAMLERDGLPPIDASALKGMFGRSNKVVSIANMNPALRKI